MSEDTKDSSGGARGRIVSWNRCCVRAPGRRRAGRDFSRLCPFLRFGRPFLRPSCPLLCHQPSREQIPLDRVGPLGSGSAERSDPHNPARRRLALLTSGNRQLHGLARLRLGVLALHVIVAPLAQVHQVLGIVGALGLARDQVVRDEEPSWSSAPFAPTDAPATDRVYFRAAVWAT